MTQIIEFKLHGLLALLDPKWGALFRAETSAYVPNLKETKYYQKNFFVKVGDKIGVGFGALKMLPYDFSPACGLPSLTRMTVPEFSGVEYRSHQREALDRIVASRMGIIEIPTGGGKSLIIVAGAEAAKKNHNVLIVVPTNVNKQEILKNAKMAGVEIKDYIETRKTFDSPTGNTYLGTATAILNDLRAKTNYSTLASVGTVFWDECSHLASETWNNVLLGLPYLERSFAFSGTAVKHRGPFSHFSEIPIEDALVYSAAGPIIYQVSAEELGEAISRPLVYEIEYKWPESASKGLKNTNEWSKYRNALDENEDRIDFIAKLVRGLHLLGRTTIVPVDTKKMGRNLLEKYQDGGLHRHSICWFGGDDIFFLSKPPVDCCAGPIRITPDEVRHYLSTNALRHIICTSHADESLDLPSLDVTILQSGKDDRRAKQRAGRVARPSSKTPIVLNLWDDVGILSTQARKRSKAVKEYFSTGSIYFSTLSELFAMIQEEDK